MWFRKTLVFSITFLFITAGTTSSIPLTVSGYTGRNTLYVGGSGPNNYTRIQDAIDDANDGDTIFVYNGTYYEHHIIIDKKIYLLGENKNSTIINVVGKHQGVQIFCDDVIVKGFTIRNNSYAFDWWCNSLLEVNKSKNVVVENNVFISDYKDPNRENHVCGICLLGSENCVLRNNTFYGCSLLIYYFDYNYSKNENAKVEYFIHDIDSSNLINGKPLYYYKNCENVIVPSDAGEIIFVNTSYSEIPKFENNDTAVNIQLICSDNNLIQNAKISDSLSGLWLHYSNHNIFMNITADGTSCSLFLWHSNYNIFQNNVLPAVTVEQYSDSNVFMKNLFKSSRTYNFSIQLESSDYNVFKCNNIYGVNIVKAILLRAMKVKNVTVIKLYNSHHTIWDKNYWGDYTGFKNVPKPIVGLHRAIYVPFNYFNFPSYLNFDWHPVNEPYDI